MTVTDYGPSFDLRTVGSSVDQDLAHFSQLSFFLESLIPSTIVQTNRGLGYGLSMDTFVAPVDFSDKLIFWSVFNTGCYKIC